VRLKTLIVNRAGHLNTAQPAIWLTYGRLLERQLILTAGQVGRVTGG